MDKGVWWATVYGGHKKELHVTWPLNKGLNLTIHGSHISPFSPSISAPGLIRTQGPTGQKWTLLRSTSSQVIRIKHLDERLTYFLEFIIKHMIHTKSIYNGYVPLRKQIMKQSPMHSSF